MNKQLLLEVADHLERFPETHQQNIWFDTRHSAVPVEQQALGGERDYINDHPEALIGYLDHVKADGQPVNCGSVGCVAGWGFTFLPKHEQRRVLAQAEDRYDSVPYDWEVVGALAFGISEDEAQMLFDAEYMDRRTDQMVWAIRQFVETGVLPEEPEYDADEYVEEDEMDL